MAASSSCCSDTSTWQRGLLPIAHLLSSPLLFMCHRIRYRRRHLTDYVWPSQDWPCHWLYRNLCKLLVTESPERGGIHNGQWFKGGLFSGTEGCFRSIVSTECEKQKNYVTMCLSREVEGTDECWVCVRSCSSQATEGKGWQPWG